jgi:peroxiredoxin
LPYRLLSDNDKKVSKLYGAKGFFFPKRITYLIDEKGKIFDILDKAKLNVYAEETIKRFQSFQTGNSQKD